MSNELRTWALSVLKRLEEHKKKFTNVYVAIAQRSLIFSVVDFWRGSNLRKAGALGKSERHKCLDLKFGTS